MHTSHINDLINYSVFDMFRTSKCSSSGRLVYARNTIKLHIQVFLRMNIWMF